MNKSFNEMLDRENFETNEVYGKGFIHFSDDTYHRLAFNPKKELEWFWEIWHESSFHWYWHHSFWIWLRMITCGKEK